MKLYVIERHQQLLEIWRQQGLRGLQVTHVDYHCDMRGLMIDRPRQTAYRIRDVREGLDEGNFLRHAIQEGIVAGVRWLHDSPGGRKYDVHTVKYSHDFTAIPHRLLLAARRQSPLPFAYDVQHIDQWRGLEPGQFLDVDWDAFADRSMSLDGIDARVEAFFSKDFSHTPVGLSACYSPYHSHDSREQFLAFVERLAGIFAAEVVPVPYQPRPKKLPWRRRLIPAGLYTRLQAPYYRLMLAMKQRGIE